jgi:D-alanyl-D-alanine carboxypeptidase (penicillin-binding protein 5/6)
MPPHRTASGGLAAISATLTRAVAVTLVAAALLCSAFLAGGASPAFASSDIPSWTITAAPSASAQATPDITATAAILIDSDSGAVLYAKNPDERLPMASTTKIMTAILVLESLELDKKVVVPKSATGTAGSLAGLVWGEVLTVEQLLYALLVPSGNDAALTLAQETAGSVQAFVQKMNEKAEEMGLTNTHFANPNGLHLENHYSSARDLATMAEYAMRDPTFRRIVDTPTYELPWPGKDAGVRKFKSGNVLLNEYPWVNGVKTGSTPYAKYCMVASGTLEGVSLIAVLLGAADDDTRWKETKSLLDYGLALFPRTLLVDRGQLVAELDVPDPLDRKVRLVAQKALTMRLAATEVVTASARLKGEVTPPVHVGEVLGVVDFSLDGTFLDSVELVAAQSLEKPAITDVMHYWTFARRPELMPAD